MFGTRRHEEMMDWIGEAKRSRMVDGAGGWVTVRRTTPVQPSNPSVALHVSSPGNVDILDCSKPVQPSHGGGGVVPFLSSNCSLDAMVVGKEEMPEKKDSNLVPR